jgi:hypothetical protein
MAAVGQRRARGGAEEAAAGGEEDSVADDNIILSPGRLKGDFIRALQSR